MAAAHFIITLLLLSTQIAFTLQCPIYKNLNQKTMLCHQTVLEKIPSKIDDDIEVFILNGTLDMLLRIEIDIVERLPKNLKELTISNTIIRILPPKCFDKFTRLTKLDLSHNLIRMFYVNTWNNLGNLKELSLSYNALEQQIFEPLVFHKLNLLEKLDLSYNEINRFEDKVAGNLTNLRELKLNNNKLASLQANAFHKSTNLVSLDLSNNFLTNFSSELFEIMPNLKKLNVSFNQLTTIEENFFKNLTSVKSIDLSNNRLISLASGAFEWLNLEYLNLENNQLTSIDKAAFRNLACNNLKLSNNPNLKFGQLVSALNDTRHVQELDLSFFNLQNDRLIYYLVDKLNNLERLNLSHNSLTRIPKFPTMNKIKEIDFSHNQIQALNQINESIPEISEKLKSKQTVIHVHHNPLTCLDCNLAALKFLSDYSDEQCKEDNYFCLTCLGSGGKFFVKDLELSADFNETALSGCTPEALSAITSKPDLSSILIFVILLVFFSIFAFLLMLYHKKIFRGVYYTGQYRTNETGHKRLTPCLLSNANGNGLGRSDSTKSFTEANGGASEPSSQFETVHLNGGTETSSQPVVDTIVAFEERTYLDANEYINNLNKRSSVSMLVGNYEKIRETEMKLERNLTLENGELKDAKMLFGGLEKLSPERLEQVCSKNEEFTINNNAFLV